MRIVRHPNIVELKAFYYSNGERVSTAEAKAWPWYDWLTRPYRKTKSTSTSFSNMSPRLSTELPDILTR